MVKVWGPLWHYRHYMYPSWLIAFLQIMIHGITYFIIELHDSLLTCPVYETWYLGHVPAFRGRCLMETSLVSKRAQTCPYPKTYCVPACLFCWKWYGYFFCIYIFTAIHLKQNQWNEAYPCDSRSWIAFKASV